MDTSSLMSNAPRLHTIMAVRRPFAIRIDRVNEAEFSPQPPMCAETGLFILSA